MVAWACGDPVEVDLDAGRRAHCAQSHTDVSITQCFRTHGWAIDFTRSRTGL